MSEKQCGDEKRADISSLPARRFSPSLQRGLSSHAPLCRSPVGRVLFLSGRRLRTRSNLPNLLSSSPARYLRSLPHLFILLLLQWRYQHPAPQGLAKPVFGRPIRHRTGRRVPMHYDRAGDLRPAIPRHRRVTRTLPHSFQTQFRAGAKEC